MRKRILIVDDHPLYRQGVRQLVETVFEVVGEAAEGGEALDKALSLKPDVVLLDIQMAGMDGLAAARQLKEQLPKTSVVIMSQNDDTERVMQAIEAGASGYVAKDDESAHLLQALRVVADGQAYFPPSVAKRLVDSLSGATLYQRGQANNGLSPREIDVLRLVAQGQRNTDVARTLIISHRTVGNHITNIYNKLGIFSRAEAVIYAIKHGLVRI